MVVSLQRKPATGPAPRAVSRRFGLVSSIAEVVGAPGDPALYFFSARLPNARHTVGVKVPEISAGVGLTPEAAYLAALGEAVERYACAVYDPEDLLVAPYGELEGTAVPPEHWALFSERQYQSGVPFAPFDHDLPLAWYPARSLVSGEERLVPAQFVFMPFRHEHEPPLAMTTSSGLACGASIEAATLSALYELVERDAVMLFWLDRLSAPGLVIDAESGINSAFREKLARPGITYHLFDFTTDLGLPVVFALLTDETNPQLVAAAGAACRLDADQAALKAAVEAAQTRVWLRQMVASDGPFPLLADYSNVHDFDEHVRLFGRQEMRRHLDFLLTAGARTPLSTLPRDSSGDVADLERAVERIGAKGFDVLAVDVTPVDVAELGLSVVRVLIPGLVQLTADHRYRMLGGRRLYEAPVALGYRDRAAAETDLNPIPHPFP